jgi:hypothetical protein
MTFRSPIEQVDLPTGLLRLALNSNAFSSASLISIIQLVTCRPLDIPIVFELADTIVKTSFYNSLSAIDFEKCYPNIAELDYSNNQFPVDSHLFFAFLFTQKRLRLLSLHHTKADDPTEFMQLLMRMGTNLPLYGLDFSGEFDPLLFAQFLQALSTWTSLRRLNVAGCGAGEGGLGALNEAIVELPDLNELGADGFAPSTPEALEPLWTTAASLPNLVACDLPVADMEALKVRPENISAYFGEVIQILRERARLSTAEQRVELTLRTIQAGADPEFSDEIFSEAAQMAWGEGSAEHITEEVAAGGTPSED